MTYIRIRLKLVVVLLVIILLLSLLTIALSSSPTDKWRPLYGGIQIGIQWKTTRVGCSIGFPAYYLSDNNVYYYIGFITAGHCGNVSNSVYQPMYGDLVGFIDRRNFTFGDVAFVIIEVDSIFPVPDTVDTKIYYSYSSDGYIVIDGYWRAEELVNKIGNVIYKSGYATSTTYGTIYDVRQNWYHSGAGIYHKYAIIAEIEASHGDSGGTVYYIENIPGEGTYVWVVGIISAYYSSSNRNLVVCSTVNDAESYLGVEPL